MNTEPSTLNDLLRRRALNEPDRQAYTYLADGEMEKAVWTYGELDRQARAIGAWLQSLDAEGGRALLLYPPGLDFIAAFFGCLYSNVVAVPAYPPHPARPNLTLPRLRSIVADSQATVVLTTATILNRVEPLFAEGADLLTLKWLATDNIPSLDLANEWRETGSTGETLAFLQYTSGSTSNPKGVMVSHRNLLRNSAYISYGFEHTSDSVAVTWLPAYHDMGLIDGIIQPLYSGFPCFLMPPVAFLQRPLRWLQAISKHRATHSGGPNFAYDLCVRKVTAEQRASLDLSNWSVAYNGAEPVRRETMEKFAEAFEPCGFRWSSFYPAYGLAEATLKVSGGRRATLPVTCAAQAEALEQNRVVAAAADDANVRQLVGSGSAGFETGVIIVNPSTLTRCAPDEVGEIWVSGPGVAQGYWNQPELSEQTFRARLSDTGEGPFLRTGDLGFLRDGELFINGRLKDLIIIGGRNHYPQDVELTVEQSHPALRPGCIAAFSVEVSGEEQLVIAAELDHRFQARREQTPSHASSDSVSRLTMELQPVLRAVRGAVSENYGMQVHALALLKVGSIPKTSSGKIRRHLCRNGFLSGELECLAVG